MINVIEYLEDSATRFPDRIAFGDPGETITFSQLEKNARAIGSYLLKNGIRQGDAVAFYMEKSRLSTGLFRLLSVSNLLS